MTGTSPAPRALTAIAVLLTIGTAATDVACFTRLGSVFASVMTSNIVFLGLSAAQHSGMLAEHASISVAAYVIGVAAASRLARTGQRASHPGASGCSDASGSSGGSDASGSSGGSDASGGSGGSGPWSRWVAATLITEMLVLAVFTAGWEITGAKPEGGAQLFLLAVAAGAMGMQSAVVAVMGIAGVSTTYLTGTLTTLVDSLASARPRPGSNARRVAALGALVAGAALSGLLLATVQAAVPAVPLASLIGAIVAGSVWLRPGRQAGQGKPAGPGGETGGGKLSRVP